MLAEQEKPLEEYRRYAAENRIRAILYLPEGAEEPQNIPIEPVGCDGQAEQEEAK